MTKTISRPWVPGQPTPRGMVEDALERCSYCERLMPDVVTYADGTKVCALCTAKERARYAEATGGDCTRCPYNLAWHVDGRCPTEDEARRWSGSH